MTIEEKQKEFLEKLDTYEDEFDKYGYVIFLGSQLEPISFMVAGSSEESRW